MNDEELFALVILALILVMMLTVLPLGIWPGLNLSGLR